MSITMIKHKDHKLPEPSEEQLQAGQLQQLLWQIRCCYKAAPVNLITKHVALKTPT